MVLATRIGSNFSEQGCWLLKKAPGKGGFSVIVASGLFKRRFGKGSCLLLGSVFW